MSVKIVKADGSTEYFKVEKLRRSLRRSGAGPDEVNRVIKKIQEEIYEGMKTQEIYRRAFDVLRFDAKDTVAARYSLRRALFNLGPTGFPFERFLARLFEFDGYNTRTGITIHGRCAPHELDVAAYNETHSFVGEAKFHARPGIKTDLQVVMYSYARLLDLEEKAICNESVCGIKEFWLVTNTKFTSTAEKYGECVGVKMLSWDYPKRDNLHDRIQRAKIYPITVMQSLSMSQISTLISHDVIICSDLQKRPEVLNNLYLSSKKQDSIMSEVQKICGK